MVVDPGPRGYSRLPMPHVGFSAHTAPVRQLAETATSLAIKDPLWMGLAILATAYALAYWFLRGAGKSRHPLQHRIAGIGGIVIGSVVGFGALLEHTTLDATGVLDRRLLAPDRGASWKDVAEVSLQQQRVGRRGEQPHLVLRLAQGGEVWIEISGLDARETERVLEFARARSRK